MTDVFSSGFVFKVRYQMRPSVVQIMLVNEVNIKTKTKIISNQPSKSVIHMVPLFSLCWYKNPTFLRPHIHSEVTRGRRLYFTSCLFKR